MRRVRLGGTAATVALVAVVFYLLGLRWSAIAVIWTAAVSAWLFIVQYWWTSRGAWRRSWIGRHVMAFVGADALVFTWAGVLEIWPWLGRMSWFEWTYLVLITGIPATIIQRMWILRTIDHLVEVSHPSQLDTTPASPPRPSRMAGMRLRHPLLLWKSILAGMAAIAGIGYLADVFGGRTAAVLVVLVAFCQQATTTYEHGLGQPAQTPGGSP